jgi:N-methylhydantoinase B
LGLKVVERGEFREDVFRTLTEQCRDPQYVGLDVKAMVAGNNVCARRYLGLVEKFGLGFVEAAGQKMIADSEEKARAKLRSMPDGTWRSRIYFTALDQKDRKAVPLQVMCTMTKRDEDLRLDFGGTSAQLANDTNSTLPSTLAHIAIALTNTLFWDVPWSDGKMRPVRVTVPEGSVLNCRFPAACGFAPWVGQVLVSALCECISKMLFAAGRYDDINATWFSLWYAGGPGYLYGGHNREGIRTAQGIYDIHGGGLGASPARDGVDTGGHMNIPSGGISDVERIEMQYPFLYFTRNHNRDGSGYGKYRGGVGSYRIFIIYGSQDFSADYKPYGGIPQGCFGLFGGYPVGSGGLRAIFHTRPDFPERIRRGEYLTEIGDIEAKGWGTIYIPEGSPERIGVPEFGLVADYVAGGGGYGDPLDRNPRAVVRDVRNGATSLAVARSTYGVVVDPQTLTLDAAKTEVRCREIREERIARARAPALPTLPSSNGREWETILRCHEYLEIARDGAEACYRCIRCGYLFCAADENYKKYCVKRIVTLEQFAQRPLPNHGLYLGQLQEYICPGCATLLQVDVYCPSLGGDEDLWDIQIGSLERT